MEQRCTATVSDIASALNLSGRAIRKRIKISELRPTGDRVQGGGDKYDITAIARNKKELQAISAYLAKTAASASAQAGAVEGRKLALAKTTKEATKTVLSDTDRTDSLQQAAQISTAGQLRADAKIAVLAAFNIYHNIHGSAIGAARRDFARAYNSGEILVEPWVRDYIPDTSPASIERWQGRPVVDLAGKYGNRAGSGTIDSDQDLTGFLRAFMAEFPHASAHAILKGMKAFPLFKEQNKQLPAKRSLQRWLQKWKGNNAQLFDKLDDPVGWSGKWLVSHGQAAADVTEPNQRWESDSSPADIILSDGKRYTLLATVDVAPRRVRVLLSPTAASAATGLLFRRCILDLGVPVNGEWRTDNGSEYRARYIQRVVADLGIRQHFCHVRSPWEKPFVEAFFRTLAHGVFELLPGFIGHSVTERKKIEGRKFVQKFMTRGGEVNLSMTFDQFQAWLDEWVNNIYQHNYHSGIKTTPFQWMANWKGTIRQIADVRALDMLLMPLADRGGIRHVTANGIRVDNGTFIAPELALWQDKDVRVYLDPQDIGQIIVYSANNNAPEFICVAVDPTRPDISRPEFAAKARAMQKIIDAEITDIRKTAKKLGIKNIMDHIRHDAAEAAGKLSYLPHARQDYITPALEAAADARAALDGKPTEAAPVFDEAAIEEAKQRWAELNEQETKVIALPTAARPMFGTDLEKYQWLTANRPLVTEDDAAWMAWYESTTEYRLMFGEDDEEAYK